MKKIDKKEKYKVNKTKDLRQYLIIKRAEKKTGVENG